MESAKHAEDEIQREFSESFADLFMDEEISLSDLVEGQRRPHEHSSSSNIDSSSVDDLLASVSDLLQSKTTFTLDESTSLDEEVNRLRSFQFEKALCVRENSGSTQKQGNSSISSIFNENRSLKETEKTGIVDSKTTSPNGSVYRRSLFLEQKQKLASILHKSFPKPVDFVMLPTTTASPKTPRSRRTSTKSQMDTVFQGGGGEATVVSPNIILPLDCCRTPILSSPKQSLLDRKLSPSSVLAMDFVDSMPTRAESQKMFVSRCDEVVDCRSPKMPERKPSFEDES